MTNHNELLSDKFLVGKIYAKICTVLHNDPD